MITTLLDAKIMVKKLSKPMLTEAVLIKLLYQSQESRITETSGTAPDLVSVIESQYERELFSVNLIHLISCLYYWVW